MYRFLSSFFSRFLPWVVLVHALVFILFWLTNSLFYASTNDYLADMIGRRINYVSLLLWASSLLALWSFLRIILNYRTVAYRLAKLFSWIYGFVSLFYIVFFYGSFNLLFSESPVQFVRIGQLIGYFRFIIDTVLILGIALLVSFVTRSYFRNRNLVGKQSGWWPLILVLLLFGVLWIIPLIYTPGSVVRGPLPEKPLFIAHRGASMLAPENTLAAANLAAKLGVYGLETDIHVSQDGKLFLLHDDTFDRTTDIKSVFPGREEERAEHFAMAEIKQLNAGKWFVEQDPFNAIRDGLVTSEQVNEYQQQVVPELSDWLNTVRDNHLVFIFDLKQPPAGHPYADSYFDITLNQVHQAGIDPVVWFLVDQEQLQKVSHLAPEMLTAIGADYESPPSVDELSSQDYRVVNVEYGIGNPWIKQYQDAGLWLNIYTVDEPWQFSRLWLLGVNSITTSNSQVMAALNHPTLSLSYTLYVTLWIVVGLAGVGLIIGLVYPVIKPRRASAFDNDDVSTL